MDLIILAKLNALKRGGGVGRTETQKLTFDGEIDGKPVLTDMLDDPTNAPVYVHISNTLVNAAGLKSLTLSGIDIHGNPFEQSYAAADLKVEPIADGLTIIRGSAFGELNSEAFDVWISSYPMDVGLPAGTYVAYYGPEGTNIKMYVSSIETETIHQIDPKFIPGAVLPVVELETNISSTGEFVALTESESALLNEVAQQKLPIVVIYHPVDGATMAIPLFYADADETGVQIVYSDSSANPYIMLRKQSGAWTGFYGSM